MDALSRFSDRVADYVRYRPGYPSEIIAILTEKGALYPGCVVADIGSGTGLSARIFLQEGFQVVGVEPNAGMREAAQALLGNDPLFSQMEGHAHDTGLPAASIDLIVCAQAFHWFDREKAHKEFRRILKPDGHVLLMWNDRDLSSPFMQAYEQIIDRFSIDYNEINHLLIKDEDIFGWFSGGMPEKQTFPYQQRFDLQGLIGRTASCSYMPNRGAERYDEMERGLTSLFYRFQQDGIVIFAYTTRIYLGKL